MKIITKTTSLLLILLFNISGYSFSVKLSNPINNKKEKVAKEEKKILAEARKNLASENYETAKVKYLELLELNPSDEVYNYETGLSFYFSTFERSKSIPYFEKALKNASEEGIPELKYYLGRAYHINGQFEKSKEVLDDFEKNIQEHKEGQYLLKETNYRIGLDENGIDYLKEKDNNVVIKNLGSGINTIDREYAPVLKKDKKVIIFTSRRKGSTGGKLAHDMLPYEDIYVAKETSQNTWTIVEDKDEIEKYLPSGYNTTKHNAGVVYSVDEKTLYIYKKDMLWKSEQEEGKWGELEKLGESVNESKLNIPSATISADGNTIYFVATRKDGFGGEDIYMITKDTASNNWNEPKNLGENINTELDEDAPFLSPDGKVFYFSSKGHKGMGGYDIYKCDVVDGELSKPINLGIPMNSPVDDIYLVIDDKNEVGFFSSDREGGNGAMDIYAFDMSCPNIENTELRGIVYNKTDKEVLQSTLTLTDTNETTVFETTTLASNGKFLITTPPDNNYNLTIKTVGYKDQSFAIKLPKQCEFFPLFIEVALESYNTDGQRYQVATVKSSLFNANDALIEAKNNGTAIDEAGISTEVPLIKTPNDNNYETDLQLLALTRTLDPENTPLNYIVLSDTVKVDPADIIIPTKSYREEYGYNVIAVNTNNSSYIKMIDEAIALSNKNGKKIIVSIESSASKVPTKTYKTNIHLASLRGDQAKETVLNSLKEKGVSEEMIEVKAINSLISGPEYNKDFKDTEKYKPHQYIIITIE